VYSDTLQNHTYAWKSINLGEKGDLFSGFPLKPKRTFLHPQNTSITSKIVGVIAISNAYKSIILGQYAIIRPLFGL